jgi:hypothetical protein
MRQPPDIERAAVNILDKKSQTSEKAWFSSLSWVEVNKQTIIKKTTRSLNVTNSFRLGFFGKTYTSEKEHGTQGVSTW